MVGGNLTPLPMMARFLPWAAVVWSDGIPSHRTGVTMRHGWMSRRRRKEKKKKGRVSRHETHGTLQNQTPWGSEACVPDIDRLCGSHALHPSPFLRACSMFLFGTLGPTTCPISLASKGARLIPTR
ncbi:hypothetical protein LZ30DRAFT_7339 [Colletotrichum cereale]|nr:hypothetical protein LZ30DRAFT_7339 [Colletotrichum cereale]